MKILKFLNKKEYNNVMRLQKENIETKEMLTFERSLNRKSKGGSGKYDRTDHIASLTGPQAVTFFNKMAKKDDGVARVLRAYFSHLKDAQWVVQAGIPGDEQSEQQAIETQSALMDFAPKVWIDNLTDILGYVRVGHAVFEPEYKLIMTQYGMRYVLWDWGWRNQATLRNWKAESGRLTTVEQWYYNPLERMAEYFTLDGKDLVIFTHEREGDNFFGESFLRPIVGNYIRKEDYYENMAIGIEKAAMGILVIETPEGLTNDTDSALVDDWAESYCVNEKSYVRMPKGYKVSVIKVDYDADKVLKAIEKENSMMLRASLLEFLDFGMDKGGGSYALDESRAVDFIKKLTVYSNYMEAVINDNMIRKLEFSNFGKTHDFSKLNAIGIKERITETYAKMLNELVTAKLLKPTPNIREYIRIGLRFPAEEENLEEEETVEEEIPNEEEDVDEGRELANVKTNRDNPREIKTDFKNLTAEYNDMYMVNATKIKDKMLADVNKALKTTNPNKALNDIKPGFTNQFALDIKVFMTEAVLTGRKQANKELKKAKKLALGDDLSADIRKWINATSDTTAGFLANDIKDVGIKAAILGVDSNTAPEKTLFDTSEAIDKHIDNTNNNGNGVITPKSIERGRTEGFEVGETKENKIEGWKYRNNSPEADICKWLVGRRVKANDPNAERYRPPNHYRCESWASPIWTSDNNTVWEGWNVPPSLQKEKTLSALETVLKEARLL